MDDSSFKAIESAPIAKSNGVLVKIISFLNKIVDPTSKVFISIAGTVVAVMMFLIFVDVGGRYVFNRPIPGSFEITEFMMVLLITFSLGYCAVRKGHIRVDLMLIYISRRANRVLDIVAYGVCAIFYVLICWQTFNHARSLMNTKLASPVLYIPIFPFVFILIVGAALLVLVFIKDTIESIYEVVKK